MKGFSVFIAILSCCIVSCKNYSNRSDFLYKNYKDGESSLILDDSTSMEFLKTSYVEDNGQEYLLHHNEFKKVIQGFNLSSGHVDFDISYPSTDPLGVKVVQGISAINLDSIFVFLPLSIRGSILIDRNGNIINRFLPSKADDLEKSLINHVSFGAMPTLVSNGFLRFIQLPLFDVLNPSNINNDFKFEVLYNMEGNKVAYAPFSGFPKFYHNEIWPSQDISMSRTIDEKNRVIYSWRFLDSLIIDSAGFIQNKLAKSDFVRSRVTPFSGIPTREQDLEKILESYKYYGVYYDKYRNLYYRTVQHSIDYDKDQVPKELDAMREFSVIVMDADFNKISEIKFPGGIYNVYRAFVGSSGFYLPKNNILNPELDENKLVIDVFNFISK